MKFYTAHYVSYDHYEFEEFIGVFQFVEDFLKHKEELLSGKDSWKYDTKAKTYHYLLEEDVPKPVEEGENSCLGNHFRLIEHELSGQ